jgi:Ser/Thr protein kinase RdoA (MazF antagonist)
VWRLDTDRGALVKRVRLDDWPERVARGSAFEQAALAAGISMPALVAPYRPAFGDVAAVADQGFFRAHVWVDTHPVDAADVGAWLGTTLAAMHRIEPLARAEPDPWWYGPSSPDTWEHWLSAGEESNQPWAELLRARLPFVFDLIESIELAFRHFGNYATTHPDVEPWNVGMSDDGPVLMDWDLAGPDSCPLVVAHAALNFSTLDGQLLADRAVRIVRAYREAGGSPLGDGPGLLSRRLGMMLARLAQRIRVSLGEEHSLDLEQARTLATQRLYELPAFANSLSRWELHLPRA